MTSGPEPVRVGIAVTTVGRWDALERLLDSLERSSLPVAAIAVANQSGNPVPASLAHREAVRFVDSGGGISRGRNDALDLLARESVDLVSFPNDHSTFPPRTLETAARAFLSLGRPAAMAGTLLEPSGARLTLPGRGTSLGPTALWRVIEPAMFLSEPVVRELRFREDLGVGGPSPWQAGEGTELLLRILESGGRVLAVPDLVVLGDGERRTLARTEWRTKLRSYARGTGYVMRLHHAGPIASTVHILTPWNRFVRKGAGGRAPAGDCLVATIGRLEGRLGRCLTGAADRLGADSLRK